MSSEKYYFICDALEAHHKPSVLMYDKIMSILKIGETDYIYKLFMMDGKIYNISIDEKNKILENSNRKSFQLKDFQKGRDRGDAILFIDCIVSITKYINFNRCDPKKKERYKVHLIKEGWSYEASKEERDEILNML